MSKTYKDFTGNDEQLNEFLGAGTALNLAGKVVNRAKQTWDNYGKKELGRTKGSDEKGFSKAS